VAGTRGAASPRELVGDRRPPSNTHDDAETRELIDAIEQAVRNDLTSHQRDVLVAITLNDIPIDVLAERLRTTRGALYKTLHDARGKLRAALAARGLGIRRHEEVGTR